MSEQKDENLFWHSKYSKIGRRRQSTVKAAAAVASSRVCGLTPRWGPTLGGAALFLLLLPAAAAQGCSQNTSRTCEECLKNVSCL